MDDMPIDTPEPLAPVYTREEYRYRALIIIEAADLEAANLAAQQLDEAAGPDTFTVGLSADGTVPATHYWCSVLVTNTQWQQLLAMKATMFPAAVISEWYAEVEDGKPQRLLSELGLQIANQEVE